LNATGPLIQGVRVGGDCEDSPIPKWSPGAKRFHVTANYYGKGEKRRGGCRRGANRVLKGVGGSGTIGVAGAFASPKVQQPKKGKRGTKRGRSQSRGRGMTQPDLSN